LGQRGGSAHQRRAVNGGGFWLEVNYGEGTGPVTVAVDSWVGEDQHVKAALMAAMVETEGGRSELSAWRRSA
jgi:hypothetical protein